MSRRVRVLILAFAGILAVGLFAWTERTNDLSRAEAVQARGALRERYRNPASRPSPQALAAELWAPTATGPVVWAPKGLRVFFIGSEGGEATIGLTGEQLAWDWCFAVRYNADSPASVNLFHCPNGPPSHI